jgi:hypothetical protein
MNKKTIITALLALVAIAWSGISDEFAYEIR